MTDNLYIDLLKKVLLDFNHIQYEEFKPLHQNSSNLKLRCLRILDKILRRKAFAICKIKKFEPSIRLEGKDWPSKADTMIGLKRLENIEFCFHEVIRNHVSGDLMETGVWRGGATIFMKALLKCSNINDRKVWVADSFEGLPAPNEKKYSADRGSRYHDRKELAISLEQVQYNFKKYDLLDDNVKFLKGWFSDTLPNAPVQKLSILRLDGDMYESTMDALVNLYPKVSLGGFVIVDDWGGIERCKQAVLDYRKSKNITEEIKTIDWTGVYWRKEK